MLNSLVITCSSLILLGKCKVTWKCQCGYIWQSIRNVSGADFVTMKLQALWVLEWYNVAEYSQPAISYYPEIVFCLGFNLVYQKSKLDKVSSAKC